MKANSLKPLASAINAYLSLDPESKNRLKSLAGQVVTLELKPFGFVFQIIFHESKLELLPGEEQEAATRISGTPIQLAAVSIFKNERHRFFADDVSMSGSAEIGHEVIALFDGMQIDWEEYFAQIFGDEAAHHTGKLLRRGKRWLQHLDKTFSANVNEFVHEEMEWLPTREILNDFFAEIDDFRMDVDRLSAKINQLQQKTNRETP